MRYGPDTIRHTPPPNGDGGSARTQEQDGSDFTLYVSIVIIVSVCGTCLYGPSPCT